MELYVKMKFDLVMKYLTRNLSFFDFTQFYVYNILLNDQLATLESEQFLIKDFYLVEVGDDSHHVAASKNCKNKKII